MDPQRSQPASHGGGATIRAALMAVLMAVFVGYIFLWVMMPTNLFMDSWLLQLRLKTTSTFFGTYQGATYLTFTFPVLFIAVFACVYLHLGKKSTVTNHNKGSNGEQRLATSTWKRPVIIKGLGIVSLIELAFFAMFIALLVWNLATLLHNSLPKITPKSAAAAGRKVWAAKFGTVGLNLGLVGNVCLSFLFFPVTRGSSILALFGLTSEASVKYHIWLGHMVMTLFTAHGLCFVAIWARTHRLYEMLEWNKTGISILAGEISLVAGLILWAATIPRIRRKAFELFFYTHHLYTVFVLFFALHVGISYTSIMLPGFLLFMIDRYLRFLQSRRGVRLLSARVLPCGAVELNFSKTKDLTYTPTSIIFVNLPSISRLQWHPFTVASNSDLESDKISVVVKKEGSWTAKLYELLSSPSPVERLDASVEGPYGPVSTNFLRHDALVMISGGSGITPFISIIRELIHTSEILKQKTPQILLISSFKNSTGLTLLDLILPVSGAPSELLNLNLRIEAFVTREKAPPPTQEKKAIRTVWFKPKPTDAPLAPVLGQNNWLWLGAIISSSFLIYLICIGVVTRYYIYPIDHNKNIIYSSSARAMLHVLFLCIGVAVAATTAFLWNKNGNARDNMQIKSMEGATPQASPNSSCYNADRELESFPQQSLSQCVNVHYGERPNLKRFLFERKETSVGVLVCGPKKLRHDVANICSSGLATNLHFESISFSW